MTTLKTKQIGHSNDVISNAIEKIEQNSGCDILTIQPNVTVTDMAFLTIVKLQFERIKSLEERVTILENRKNKL